LEAVVGEEEVVVVVAHKQECDPEEWDRIDESDRPQKQFGTSSFDDLRPYAKVDGFHSISRQLKCSTVCC
jgi:hypothetical protein